MSQQVSDCRKAGILTIIQSTHASLGGLKKVGLLERHRRLLREYSKNFDVVVYSSDTTDYSQELGVEHHPMPWLPKAFGLRHAIYYLWLILQACKMKGVIKVFGSNIPTLPIVKLLSSSKMMVTYQWGYAEQSRLCKKRDLRYWLGRPLEWLALRPADIVSVTTKRLEAYVEETYRKKTILLPNWVDFEQIKKIPLSRNKELVLYAGRLHKIKGVDYLIKAFSIVKEAHPKAKLIICGTGKEIGKLQRMVQELGVRDVEFTGSVPNKQVLALMKSAAIFVLPTVTMEGHPKALIEAMACGASCVVSDVPGNEDIIVNGHTGILVPASNINALSNALEILLANQSLRDRLGQAAQLEAYKYSFSRIVSREIRVLTALCNTRQSNG